MADAARSSERGPSKRGLAIAETEPRRTVVEGAEPQNYPVAVIRSETGSSRKDPSPRTQVLDLSGVSVSYGRSGEAHRALSGVDLTVGAGEIVGLVGESGSGKTTLIRSVLGLLTTVEGKVEVCGQNMRGLGRRERSALRPRVQAVFQDPHGSFDPRQRIGSGLDELRKLHRARTGWITNQKLLALVELPEECLDRYPHQLSGGQAQRVAIARAIFLKPDLLIADEATSSLDVSVQAQVVRVLLDLQATTGVSILFVSHDLALVRQVCQRVYVLRSGEVVESGETETVLRSPRSDYARELVASLPAMDVTRHRETTDEPTKNDSLEAEQE